MWERDVVVWQVSLGRFFFFLRGEKDFSENMVLHGLSGIL